MTLIDKAEAHDDDLIRRGDALAFVRDPQARADIAALPARGVGVRPDIAAIEAGGKRWHGEDHRVVAVRWEPYKPDGARQMKAKGRWQERVGTGDYWRWQNCDRPQFLAALEPAPTDAAQAEITAQALSEMARDDAPFIRGDAALIGQKPHDQRQ